MLTTKDMWHSFVQSNDMTQTSLPEYIVDSWKYCADQNVNPYQEKGIEKVSILTLNGTKNNLQKVVGLIRKEIGRLQEFFDVKKPLFIVTDKNGVVVWRDGHTETKHLADDIQFSEGSIWTEKAVGTNAIGIALRTLEGVTVDKFEHFTKASHPFTCTSTPILDSQNEVIACINVSTMEALNETKYTLLALQMIAKNVQDVLIEEDFSNKKMALLEVLKEPLERSVLCDRQGKIVSLSSDFDEDEKRWQGKELSDFLDKYPERYHREDLTMDNQVKGIIYRFPKKTASISYVSFGIESQNQAYNVFLKQLLRAADSELPIHVYGETGSGKEVSAKTIHFNSPRRSEKLIAVNCGALSENLLESELFGYASGAFTGAQAGGYQGKFQQVNGGTLFLDEIDSMSKRMQVSLLRVLEEKKITPIGSEQEFDVDFRLVTASNQNLKQLVSEGKFREDLFYRLYVIPLNLPPLRERQEDIDVLIHHFCMKHHWHPSWIKEVSYVAKEYEWVGNIREFHNFLERLSLFYETNEPSHTELHDLIKIGSVISQANHLKKVSTTEKDQLLEALEETNYHITQTAEKLGIARSTLYRKIDKYQIKLEN